MNVDSAKHPRDIVLTCYICDDQYTGDMIESHLEECKYDWNVEEIDKPENERIPVPKPTSEFSRHFEAIKQLALEKELEGDLGKHDRPSYHNYFKSVTSLLNLYSNHLPILDSQNDDRGQKSSQGKQRCLI
jgi:hypothetical protein